MRVFPKLRQSLFPLCLVLFGVLGFGASAQPRERISFNEGWRFQRGDPQGSSLVLDYDFRPEVKEDKDDKAADSKPQEAETRGASSRVYLKPWILPTGNEFIRDAARRFVRPAGNPPGEVAYAKADFDDCAWQRVDLPHDWAISGPFLTEGNHGGMGRLPSWGIGWYRKKLSLSPDDAGRSVYLEVDGAMSYASVWVNGQLAGGWPYGYTSWRIDLTPYVKFGAENQVAIRLDNPPSSSRWYPGGGIYRNVWIVKAGPVQVAHWGTRVVAREVSQGSATLELETNVDNRSAEAAELVVKTDLFLLDEQGRRGGVPAASFEPRELRVPAGGRSCASAVLVLADPKLWGPPPTQTPHRYVAVTTILGAGRELDRYETPFGIRELRFDPERGLFVNGERVPIRGVNQHHDLGALGAAFNLRAARRQLEALREMGCNALRMSHNPPAPELLDLADELGFLVMDEAFDIWERKKTPLDAHLIFPDWHEQDLRALLRRDRNHPSVILWSIGNEVGEQYTDAPGAAVARRLVAIAHEEDPTRPVTCAMNYASPEMPLPAELDAISLNYQGEGIRDRPEFEGTERIRKRPQYELFHRKFPGKVILSSETASAFSTRGSYLFPVSKELSAPVRDGQGGDDARHIVTAYELHAVDFGSSVEKVFGSLERHPFVAGEFVWTGWDHLGEPTPYYFSRSSYCGIIDMAGFRKDRFYLYQSHWRPELPMAHLLPHWTWPERVGQVTPVHVFTSGEEAELFLNGRSLGRRSKAKYEYRLRWDEVRYEPGVLEVVAYRDGRKWASDTVKTAGEAVRLEALPDRRTICADGLDLCFVTVRVTDREGLLAPRAMNALKFEVGGPGEFVASDNGDPTNFEPFTEPRRKAFNGLCLVVVKAKPGQKGKIRVGVSGEGLLGTVAEIEAVGAAR